MTFRNVMLVSGTLALGFGLGFVLLPESLAALYGLELSPSGRFMARLFGVELFGFGLLAWLLRKLITVSVQRSVLLAFLITDGIGFVVSLLAQLAGLMNAFGWSIVLIYLLLSLAFARLYLAGRQIQQPTLPGWQKRLTKPLSEYRQVYYNIKRTPANSGGKRNTAYDR